MKHQKNMRRLLDEFVHRHGHALVVCGLAVGTFYAPVSTYAESVNTRAKGSE